MFNKSDIDAYFDVIKADYLKWAPINGDRIREEMYNEFCDGLDYEVGSKYLKIVKRHRGGCSVHSFICLKDTNKFKKGDILMAASFKAPATNFARGNLLEKTFDRIRWTGAM